MIKKPSRENGTLLLALIAGLSRAIADGMPKLAAACLLSGLLLYSAIVHAAYPQIGSNFLPSIICVALVFWIGFKLKGHKMQDENIQEKFSWGSTLVPRSYQLRFSSSTPHSIWWV